MLTPILAILDDLTHHSNPDHPRSATDLTESLQQAGITIDRRTVYRCIKALQQSGYDIELVRVGKKKGYALLSRTFDDAELKLLLDAVQASSFITEKKTAQLTEKLLTLTDQHQAAKLSRNITYSHTKSSNEAIFYNVDAINQAINDKQAISFHYFDYDLRGEKRYRRKKRYQTVPYALLWQQDRYYCIGYSEKYQEFTHYRVDKMEHLETIPTDHVFQPFSLADYTKNMFDMYRGDKKRVTLSCSLAKSSLLVDRFGDNLFVTAIDRDRCTVIQDVVISPLFWGWLLQMTPDIALLGPPEVCEQYRQHLLLALDQSKC